MVALRRLRTVLRALLIGAVVLAAVTVAVFQLPAFGGRPDAARRARMTASPQYVDGRFENTPPQNTERALLRTLRLYRQGYVREPTFAIPVVPMPPEQLRTPPARAPRGLVRARHGPRRARRRRILTDPVLSDRVSPVPVGPTRFHPPPIALADLTGIDAVVISHDHYDHLDMATVRHLAAQGTHFYVGLGIGAHLERWHVPAGADPRAGLVGVRRARRACDHLHAGAPLLGPPRHGQLHPVDLVDAARRRRRRLLQRRHRLRPALRRDPAAARRRWTSTS